MEITRRDFVGVGAAAAAALGAAAVVGSAGAPTEAQALNVTAEDGWRAPLPEKTWEYADQSDELLNLVLQESEVAGDVTLPDGTVIPEVYVRLRNRINRIGKGIGSQPMENSWEMLMRNWTPEDAQHELEMPLLKIFNAYDYAVLSGRTEEECAQICKEMAEKCQLIHYNRSGVDYYMCVPYVNGFWEFMELNAVLNVDDEATLDFLSQGISGRDLSGLWEMDQMAAQGIEVGAAAQNAAATRDFDNTFPLFRSYPVSKEVIREDEFLPYQDWEAVINRHTTFCLSPCQCRTMYRVKGVEYSDDIEMDTCVSCGETAEYFIERNLGRQVSREEVLEVYHRAVEAGHVITSIGTSDPDIFCICDGRSCGNLTGVRAIDGNGNCLKNYNFYLLDYDKDTCIQCGACIERCPLMAITFGDDGYCVMDNACIRCGQCVMVCPVRARELYARDKETIPNLPHDYLDYQIYVAKDRMQRGFIWDFTDSTLPEE